MRGRLQWSFYEEETMGEANEPTALKQAQDQATGTAGDNVVSGHEWRHKQAEMRHDPDAIRELFLTGEYPYSTKMATSDY
jgi:hypothetical protein